MKKRGIDIRSRLKEARAALGMSQKEIAEQSGVSVRGYQGYEDGRSIPGGEAIDGLIRLGVNANWLFTGQGNMLASNGFAANQERAEYSVERRPEAMPCKDLDVMMLTAIIAAVDMANPRLGASERAAIAAKAYAEAIDQSTK